MPRISLRLLIGGTAFLIILLVGVTSLAVSSIIATDALRSVAQSHAVTLTQDVRDRLSDFFFVRESAAHTFTTLASVDNVMLPTDDADPLYFSNYWAPAMLRGYREILAKPHYFPTAFLLWRNEPRD